MFAFFRQGLDKWLFRLGRTESGEVFLDQRRVFIIPSGAGLMFGLMLALLFIGAVNYNLSLGFGLTFLLAACAIIDMHLTFRNLAYLYLVAGRAQPVFVGEEARFELHVINRSRHNRHAVWLGFAERGSPYAAQAIDVATQSSGSVALGLAAARRGWLAPPRVRLQTRFPLGLLRAWSYWKPDVQALIYPQPEAAAPPLPLAGAPHADGKGQTGQEDFAGVRAYQSGDSLKRLSWRHIARLATDEGGPLIAKHFEGGASSDLTLDLTQLPRELDIELKLSRLTRWVLEAESQGMPYALRLGSQFFPASLGEAHRSACLRALALYQA